MSRFFAYWRAVARAARSGRDVVTVTLRVAGIAGAARMRIPPVNARAFLAAIDRAPDGRRRRLAVEFIRRHCPPSPVDSWRGTYAERVKAAPLEVQDHVARELVSSVRARLSNEDRTDG